MTTFNIAVVGSKGCGKSCFIDSCIEDGWDYEYIEHEIFQLRKIDECHTSNGDISINFFEYKNVDTEKVDYFCNAQ